MNKTRIFAVLMAVCMPLLIPALSPDDRQWVEKQKKFFETTPARADTILTGIRERFVDSYDRIEALALLQTGMPYLLFCLGEEKEPDKDPIFRLDSADCATLVMTTAALLHCSGLNHAKTQMIKANYRHAVTYQERLHYTTDRIEVSPFFEDITEKVAGRNRIRIQKTVLNKKKSDGRRNINISWEKEIEVKYIPNEFITRELLKKAPRACGVAFTKEGYAENGLDVGHEGLLIHGKTLIHASSKARKVVKTDFYEYYFGKDNPGFSGIVLFEIK